jgi:hypothetical protein
MTEFGQFGMFLAVAAGAIAIFFGPIGRAVGRLIDGSAARARHDGAGEQLVHELRARLEQLEAERGRMAELEERLDFAERVLAHSDQPARLPGRLDS